MTTYTRQNLPADIHVFAGALQGQPLVFAHLLDVAPDLDLTHVEVIQSNHTPRLSAHFDRVTCARLDQNGQTLILILPAAHRGLKCPITQTTHLRALGAFRGTIPHLGPL
ncbi:MAG TPA: hypothetical protein EYP31_10005 [Roseibacterium sp.]|nr:hypothetical protein [Roseibacterium sp.]